MINVELISTFRPCLRMHISTITGIRLEDTWPRIKRAPCRLLKGAGAFKYDTYFYPKIFLDRPIAWTTVRMLNLNGLWTIN